MSFTDCNKQHGRWAEVHAGGSITVDRTVMPGRFLFKISVMVNHTDVVYAAQRTKRKAIPGARAEHAA
jgi:hypothetical protein